jgi:phospho-N-acetylmuramoyl-pentapeptide-transferase
MMPTVWPFVLGFAAAAVVIPLLIFWQRSRKVGQQIYDDGPRSHAAKQGTPTMGGVAFLVAAIAAVTFFPDANDQRLMVLVGGAGFIGAADDLLILVNRRALGLQARWKFAFLAALAVIYLVFIPNAGSPPSTLERWFGGIDVALPSWLWWLLSIAAIVGTANALNLTDGLDGLAAGTTIAPLVVLSLAALSPMSAAVLGACVAFLWFNRHPARIFMGDAGSLLLGALLAGDAIQVHWLLLLPLLGAVYVAEALSVILQVASFKLTGKRIFKMSPLHHHFELLGWNEWRVTSLFIAASAIATAATVWLLFATSTDAYRIVPVR